MTAIERTVEKRECQPQNASHTDPLSSRERLAALGRYRIFDTEQEPGFDGLARLAAEICGTPVGLITFVDDQRQFFKAVAGFTGDRTSPLDVGFCPQVVREQAPVTIEDTFDDPRHANNAAAIEGGIRFYAGVPLVTSDDHVLGTLCVLDTLPRSVELTPRQQKSLADLAIQVVSQLELRRNAVMAQRAGARAEKHARRLSLIADISKLLLAARDPISTVKDLFGILQQGFHLDVGFHYRCGEGTPRLVAAAGLTPEQESSAVRLEFGQTVCGIVAERREPMHVPSIQNSNVELFRPLKGLGLQTYFSTPLLAGGNLLGTISFGRRDKDFSSGELEALQTITSQLALSLERQHAETELHESEVRRTAALAASRLGAFEWDPTTGAVILDDRSRSIFGFAPGEGVRDEEVFGRIHPEEAADVQARATVAVETRSRLEASYRIVRPDGTIRMVDSLSDFMLGNEPDAGRMVGVFSDVTDRKRAEDALRESERELRFALRAGRFGAWTLDLVTYELTTSETCRINFGRDPDEPFTYKNLRNAIHPDDRERMSVAVEGSIATGADYDIEYRIVTPKGEVRWVLIRAQPSFGAGVGPLKITGVSIDVTDRKRSETRKSCLVELADALQELQSSDDIAYAAAAILGRALGVSRVGYAAVDPDAETLHVERDWTATGVESLAGVLHLRDYGTFIDNLKRGECIAISDVRDDTRTAAAASALERKSARSFVNMPVVERSRLRAVLYVNHAETRDWSADELALIQEFGARTRTAVERIYADTALRKSETRYRTLFENVESGFCVFDVLFEDSGRPIDYSFVEVNPAFEAQTGLVDAIGRRVSELAPGHEQRWYDLYGEVALTGVPSRFEDYAQALGRWYEIYAYRVDDPEKRRVAALFNDVSERKKTEAHIRELNETLERRVAERTAERNLVWLGSRDILVVADRDGIFRDVNPAWTRILGHANEDVVGRSFADFVWPEDLGASTQALKTAGSGADIDGFENRYRSKDGTPRWISWRTAFEGDLIYGYGRDVTADKQHAAELALAQEALRQSQKMEAIGQLTGGVAHDFNNLLTIIRSSTELLQRPNLAEDRRKRYVDAISDTVDRASKLTGQLLAFARRQALKPEVFDVGARLKTVTDMLTTIVGSRIQIERHMPHEPCFIEADVSQFEIALINLAVNARDAMNGEGLLKLVVRLAAAPPTSEPTSGGTNFVAVTMSDTGTGIPEEKITRIFEPFFTTKAMGKGTGLGLSQVFGFAKQSGGNVTVESEVGRGTRFTLYLPQAEATMATASCALDTSDGGDGEGRRVLVVEDNVDVGTFSTQILQDLGYETTWAAGAEEALTILADRSREFDAVFSDVVMPGMNGLELGREIRRLYPRLPVVLTSGYSDVLADDTRHGFELLQKPYAIKSLSKILRKTIGKTMQQVIARPE